MNIKLKKKLDTRTLKSGDIEIDCGPIGDIVVPLSWIKYVTRFSDVFAFSAIGYWAFGVLCEKENLETERLVFEHNDTKPTQEQIDEAVEAWECGSELPAKWFLFDKEFALRAYLEGVKKHGVEWYANGDSNAYDNAIQRALFDGEVRYG